MPFRRDTRRDAPTLSPEAEAAFDGWLLAMSWQRAVDRALRPLNLTHTQFLVLRGAALATARFEDAVSQQEIADAARVDRHTTSAVVRRLDEAGLLDKNIHGLDNRMYRILVTDEGRRCLEQASGLLDRVAISLGQQ